jgi:hypothetical protein
MSKAEIGAGATCGYKISPATTYTLLGNLISVETDPSVGKVMVDFLSATAKYKLPTILDSGEVTATIAFDSTDSQLAAMWTAFTGKTIFALEIILAGGGKFDFATVFLTGMPLSGVEQESSPEIELKFEVSGTVIFTPGT